MAGVSSNLNGGVLVISLDGRIDSSNAADVEAQVKAATENPQYDSVVLDVENLEYISSAGLRIILRLRKENATIKIINANTEVYEIFDMTGFTEMMTIEKAYRKISIEGCEVIGQGANGKVYRIDRDTIVKHYFNDDALPDIHRERELARKAFIKGIPTAIPYDVVKCDQGYGSVFELLNAKSFAKLLMANPEDIDHYVSLSVDVLKKMHSTDVSPEDMPNQKDVAIKWVKDVEPYLPVDVFTKLKTLIENVPDSTKMMHGDYHIKNIMMQDGEVLLIDMDTLCYGNPVFEFGSIYNAYIGFSDLDHGIVDKFLGLPYEITSKLWEKTLEMYFGTSDRAVLDPIEKKAILAGTLRIFRRGYTRGAADEYKEHYKNKLIKLVNELDDIAF